MHNLFYVFTAYRVNLEQNFKHVMAMGRKNTDLAVYMVTED